MTHATKAAMSDYKASRFLACLSGCANGKILCDPLLFKNLNRILNAGACQYEAIRNMEKEYKSRRRFQTAAGGQKKHGGESTMLFHFSATGNIRIPTKGMSAWIQK